MSRGLVTIALALACTAIGLATGWHAAGRSSPGGEASGASAPAAPTTLPPETLRNLGVTVAEIAKTHFVRTVPVAAIVEDTPRTEQPVYTPVGGRIESIVTELGRSLEPGAPIARLIRDPLPRPTLTLTAGVLQPAQENLHVTVLALRRSAAELEITQAELSRVEKFTGTVGADELPIIPRSRAIDLRYQRTRAESAVEEARLEFRKHGLSDAQIDGIAAGEPLPPLDEQTWKRALARNGFWTAEAEQLHATLPANLRALPWVTATVGELAASGLVTAELTEWFRADPDRAQHFLEIGVILQKGHTLADIDRLHSLGAFDPVVTLRAPPLPAGSAWDVDEIVTSPGARIAAGEPVARLRDPSRLYLRSQPVGSEVSAILRADREGWAFTARPLVLGTGPDLSGLRIAFVRSTSRNGGAEAFVEVENTILRGGGASSGSRTWHLRSGLQYVLEVPVEELADVYVLPADAVTERGVDLVVFVQDGKGFKAVAVEVLYRNESVVVLPATGATRLFPGDPVVLTGAFALGLALQGSGGIDAHAGHSH